MVKIIKLGKLSVFYILGLLIIGTSGWAACKLPNSEITTILKELVTINLTVAIGLGAISIAIKKDKEVFELLREILLIMLFSVLSYFLSYTDQILIKRVYLFASSSVLVTILLETARFIIKHYASSNNEKPKKKKGVNKKNKKNKK